MSQEFRDDHITKKKVVLRLQGMDEVRIRRDVEYTTGAVGRLTLDLYTPPHDPPSELRPAVLLVAGYPDPGMERILGCRTKDMGAFTSWARLIAVSGRAAVAYTNREPERDLQLVLRYLRENGATLGIDSTRIGLLAASGHAPLAVAALIDDKAEHALRCAALICPLLLDLDGFTAVADMASQYRFSNPAIGKTLDDLPADKALFIARAGRDETIGLNETLDRFVLKALARDLPVTLINLRDAPHAFDLMHDVESSREAIRAALGFLRFQLEATPA